jgi:hypothetical protein
MNGAPTSASTGSPLGAPLLETVTPRFGWFIPLLSGPLARAKTQGLTPTKAGSDGPRPNEAVLECYRIPIRPE